MSAPDAEHGPAADEPSPRDAALAYTRLGWSVVPVHSVIDGRCTCGDPACASPAKHPRVRWEGAMRTGADEARVRAWWDRWPTANVGVVTGVVSGLVVLDVDPRHGGEETLAALVARLGALAPTPEVITGGGGRHLYLAHPGRVVPTAPLAPGLDVKADGGVVVAPPSRHAAGERYRWSRGCRPDQVPLGATPAWVVDHVGSAVGAPGAPASGAPDGSPPRTHAERAEFSALWALVGIDLRPGDRYYLCPFHDDHRPSLHVDAEGCRWYCFGCERGGGPAALRQEIESRGVDVSPALEARSPAATAGPAGAAGEPAAGPAGREAPPPPSADETVPASWRQWPTVQPGGDQPVSGEAGHQEALERAAGGRTWGGPVVPVVTARLVREPGNLEDPEAVRVEVGGETVGHLPAGDAARFHPLVARLEDDGVAATVRAWITGGWDRGPAGRGWFGLELDVDPRLVPREPGCPFLPPGPPAAVVGEERHQEALARVVGASHGAATVAELTLAGTEGAPGLGVLVDGEEVGHLGDANARRFAPLVRSVTEAGYPATCAASVIEGARRIEVYLLLPRPDLADVP